MHQFEASGVALQQQSELDQADDHRKEFATSAGQHVLVPGPLPGLLVGLLGQDPRFDKLFEPNRGHLLGDVSLTREVFESSCTP